MNYYLFQSKFFIVFIAIAAMSFAAIPFMKNSFADASDSYIKSQMDRIQSEMLFIDQRKGVFKNVCTSGAVGGIVSTIIQENSKIVRCRTNKPIDSQMIVYAQLKSGQYYCVDSYGISCEISTEPRSGFRCKDL